MSLMSRMAMLLKATMSQFLERAEDPRVTLDYSYEKQLELVQNVKRGIVDVVTSRRRLELNAAKLRDTVARLDGQARQALAAGREDLARLALERKQVAQLQLQDLESQIAALAQEQEKLQAAESRLTMKVEAFRTRKETIKAQYAAAEAQVHIGQAATGLSEEMADVGLAVQRAEDKTEKMRARAGAIDELVASGTLEDLAGGRDLIERELAQLEARQSVEQELAAMKRQLAPGEPKALKEGQ